MRIEAAPASNDIMTYDEAVMYCFLCTHNGHKDWRLPTSTEYKYLQPKEFPVCWYLEDPFKDMDLYYITVPVRTPND